MKHSLFINNFKYEDGKLFWNIKRKGVQFGKELGLLGDNGYLFAMFNYKHTGVHRLIYQYHNPNFDMNDNPMENQIDHIDGNRTNNKIENLRLVTCQQNHMNRTKAKGYSYEKSRNKWRASICTNGKCRIIGRYSTEEEARVAYLEAKKIEHII